MSTATILVVSDDPLLLACTESTLEDAGCRVISGHPAEALGIAHELQYNADTVGEITHRSVPTRETRLAVCIGTPHLRVRHQFANSINAVAHPQLCERGHDQAAGIHALHRCRRRHTRKLRSRR